MTFKYRKELIIASITLVLCISAFGLIKVSFFNNNDLDDPIKHIINFYNAD